VRAAETYHNAAAPLGPTSLKVVVLRAGRGIKIKGRGVGLALATSEGTVGVRLTTGTVRNCALFTPPTVRKDVPGYFAASGPTPSSLVDCATLVPGATTTSSSSTTSTTSSTTTSTSLRIFPSCGTIVGGGGGCDPGICFGTDVCTPTFEPQSTNPF